MNSLKTFLAGLCLIVLTQTGVFAQKGAVIDQVIAIVGGKAILKSDLESQILQIKAQGMALPGNPHCVVLEDMLFQKLLYNQAMIDSVTVSDDQVESVLERRLRFFIQQIGSREKLEAYYGKTIDELKDEFREIIREQELSQQMQQNITKNVRISPTEVRQFFRSLPEDSIPMIDSELELAQILIIPPVSLAEKNEVKDRLEQYRNRILKGESFSTLAILYSEDPGSARKGGELGFYGRGELYPEFEAVAFGLKPGEISEVLETKAGFHIIQMIERRGELINVRHILLQPKNNPYDMVNARNRLDSIANLVRNGEMTFAQAALQFSDDPGKINEGLLINPYTGNARFKPDQIEPSLFFAVDKLEKGQITGPLPTMTEDGKQAFRIVMVRKRTLPHKANLEEDYDYLQQLALEHKKRNAMNDWAERRIASTYVHIIEEFRSCDFDYNWIKPKSSSKK